MDTALISILAAYVLFTAFGWVLEWLNIGHLKRSADRIPPELEDGIDSVHLTKAALYLAENAAFAVVSSAYNSALIVLFVLFGLGPYNAWVSSLGLPFVAAGAIFFIILFYAETVLHIPLSLWRNFVIEKRHGFNAGTPGIWAVDLIKSSLVSTAVIAGAATGALWLVEASPGLWWLWLWGFFLAFSVFMIYVSPYVIEPLFNRFEPVEDSLLKDRIAGLAESAGIRVERILKIDASRRTRHTNAYFTGIGRVKRIVLYDTLLERLDTNEIIAVLAHEIGHWKKRHVLKHLFIMEALAFAGLYISFRVMETDFLNRLFDIEGGTFFTKAVALGFVFTIIAYPFEPLFNYVSRRHEYEADAYAAAAAGGPSGMTGALVKLSKDNLSNPCPHPLYVALHYSHPPVADRIRNINRESR